MGFDHLEFLAYRKISGPFVLNEVEASSYFYKHISKHKTQNNLIVPQTMSLFNASIDVG